MSEISMASVPKRDFVVRRRKYQGQCWLVSRTSYYEIDEAVDAVWMKCNGDVSAAEIARTLAEERALTDEAADSMTKSALALLLRLGLVRLL